MKDRGGRKMKNRVGLFVLLLLLFPACGTPVATETVTVVQRAQTPSPFVTLISSPNITSTPERHTDTPTKPTPFCQPSSRVALPGLSVDISAFNLQANHLVSVYVGIKQIKTSMTNTTDSNGNVKINIMMPTNTPIGLYQVSVYAEGSFVPANCVIWVWPEANLPLMSPIITQRLEDTLNCNQGEVLFSPDGLWAVLDCKVDAITIIHIDETKEWNLSSDTLIGLNTENFISLSRWSKDGVYAYISANPHTDGYWEPFHEATNLFRLNLKTGQISEILKGKYYSFSFSPNDRRLVYIVTDQSPAILNIRDMQTGDGQSFTYDPKYNTGGGFLWSPDSQKLVFSITQYDTSIGEYIATSIILWDRERPDTMILIKDYQEILVPVRWIDETRLILQILYEDDIKFEYDLISDELTPINP